MREINFSKVLRDYRKKKQLTVAEVAALLSKNIKTVSSKSVYSWENGTTKPSADALMYLCELYEINDVLGAFGFANNSIEYKLGRNLTKEEAALIEAYRNKPEFKQAVRKLYDLE